MTSELRFFQCFVHVRLEKVVSLLFACCSSLKTINSKQLWTDANHLINSPNLNPFCSERDEQMRGREEKRQEGGVEERKKRPDKTSARFAHLCQAKRARPTVRGRRREREILRGGGRREKKRGGDGGMVPMSTSARNCLFWGGNAS